MREEATRDTHGLASGLRYRAFLSYRSSDRRLAKWLHRRLERYRLPRALVGATGRHGPLGRWIGPVFLDRADARTAADIDTVIAEELSRSQHLIVLCTPRAAEAGSWVPREIALFRQRCPGREIHAVIGAGQPPGCFPEPLRRSRADGGVDVPLAADLRPRRRHGQDGRRRALVKLIAGLLGIDFDDLWRRETRRRRNRAIAAGLAGLCALGALVGAYAVADGSRFVREEAGRLSVWKGWPGANLPGYPQPVWHLSTDAASLMLAEGTNPSRAVLAVGPWSDVASELRRITRDDHLAAQFASAGDTRRAREVALGVVDDPDRPFEQWLHAWLVMAEVATSEDEERLFALLQDPRAELRLAGARALFRLNPATALRGLRGMRSNEREALAGDLVHLLSGSCTHEHLLFLEDLIRSPRPEPDVDDIFDAAVRSQCVLSADVLAQAARRADMHGNLSVGAYARLTQVQAELSERLLALLRRPDLSPFERENVTTALFATGTGTCDAALFDALGATDVSFRLKTMATIARLCPQAQLRVAASATGTALVVTLIAREREPERVEVEICAPRNPFLVQFLLGVRSLAIPDGDSWPAMIHPLLRRADDHHVRVLLIDALIELRDTAPIPARLRDSNSLEVRAAAIEHRRTIDEAGIAAELLERLGSRDEFYDINLGRIALDPSALARVRALLHGDAPQRRQAAGVLAMQASAAEVVGLLTHPDAEIRDRAIRRAPFNREIAAIAAQLPTHVGSFGIEGYTTLQEQAAQKHAYQQELSALPDDLRRWRLAVTDVTPAGWGRWGQGMRAWIHEQRFQARRR